MEATRKSVHAVTARDVMNPDLVVVEQQMLVREAVCLLQRTGADAAAVVDDTGRCVGMLSPAGVFRWVKGGCSDAVISPILTCPYQVRGRLLTGGDAVICILAHGSCAFQAAQPTTAGRHTEICTRQEAEPSPFGALPCYMTTNVVTVRSAIPLMELVRRIVDARVDRVVVLDEFDRPIGIASATDALSRVADELTNER